MAHQFLKSATNSCLSDPNQVHVHMLLSSSLTLVALQAWYLCFRQGGSLGENLSPGPLH